MRKDYDKNKQLHKYSTGDLVWLHKPRVGIGSKLQCPWDGPYAVVNCLNDVIYRIKKNPKSKCKIVHHNLLKPYKGNRDLE